MNNRFRFRKPVFSKDKKFKKFVYFELFDMPDFTARSSDIIGKEEQCVGLKDNNGNLIYEGDIVRIDEEIAAIKWNDTLARFIIETEDTEADFDNFHHFELEVIGNIHENMELLEGKNEK